MATLHFENLRGRAVTRDPREEHRASTPLELFFDLTFVVAVGRVADAYQHELAIGETARGVVYGGLMFFGIWWAWMNFTWFASAHDADDVPYRLLTFVQIAGALVFAAGVTRAVEDRWFVACVVGYIIMRVGLILSWLRVARDEPTSRTRALRYAALIAAVQVLWVGMLALPTDAQLWVFLLLGAAELGIPVVAERALPEPPFHAEHIEERYGLFTIILLGESVLSAAAGFQDAVDDGGLTGGLLAVGLGSLLIAFAAWWLYFDNPGHLAPTPRVAFRWGYGHIVVFGSLAAIGGGLHLAASSQGHDSEIDARTAALAVALAVAGYLVGLAVLLRIVGDRVSGTRIWPKLAGAAAAAALGAVANVPVTVVGCGLVLAGLAATMVVVHEPPGAAESGRRSLESADER